MHFSHQNCGASGVTSRHPRQPIPGYSVCRAEGKPHFTQEPLILSDYASYTHHATHVKGAAPQPWVRLGERTIEGAHASRQVRELLDNCLPAAVCPDGLIGSVEQAVLEAVARKQPGAEKAPLVIISCLDEKAIGRPCDKTQVGWSFFVIERPVAALNDVIELCLYYE